MPPNNGDRPDDDGPDHGHNPWGAPGDIPRDTRPGGARRPDRPNPRPETPWGAGGAPGLDALLAQAQGWARRVLPDGGQGGGHGAWGGGRGALLIGIAALALWLASGFYRVEPDEQGVVLRFGAFVRTTPPGLNYHLPWPVETVALPAVTRVNRVEIGYRAPGVPPGAPLGGDAHPSPGATPREVAGESLMLTGDENIVDVNFSVFWRVGSAPAFLFNTRNPAATVKAAAESVMREVIGSTPIQPALAEARAQIETAVLRGTQAILDQYKAGVEITQVQLQKVDPPAAVIDSFRDVQRANTDAERMRNEADSYRNDIVPRARGDAARITAEADADRQAAVAAATGQAQRFESVLAAYQAARDVTLRRLYIETMQEVLTHTPTVVVDGNARNLVPFLPLGDAGRLPASPAPVPPAAAAGATR